MIVLLSSRPQRIAIIILLVSQMTLVMVRRPYARDGGNLRPMVNLTASLLIQVVIMLSD